MPTDDEFLQRKQHEYEALLSELVDAAIYARAEDPREFFLGQLLQMRERPQRNELVEASARQARLAAASATNTEAEPAGASWSLPSWLATCVAGPVAAALVRPLSDGEGEPPPHVALRFVRALGEAPSPEARRGAVRSMLTERVLDGLADAVGAAAQELVAGGGETAQAVSKKFEADGTFTYSYASLDSFYAGLEGRIGAPDPNLREAMAREHLESADSRQSFVTANYGVETRSEVEWYYVADPSAGLAALGLAAWPRETHSAEEGRARAHDGGVKPLEAFDGELSRVNAELKRLNEPALLVDEVLAGRLYTGPMFEKYQIVCRAHGEEAPEFLRAQFDKMCLGNKYTTTLHVLKCAAAGLRPSLTSIPIHAFAPRRSSVVVKLSKLTVATKVYRGSKRGVLPEAFWKPNKYGVRGGVDTAFLSTSTNRQVAAGYAQGGDAPMVFEMEQGMVDRGADISWLSQYPGESEVLFGPLTCIELRGTRVEGGAIVAELSMSINLMSPTIEEVVGKRKKLLQQATANMKLALCAEAEAEGSSVEAARDAFDNAINAEVLRQDAAQCNTDERFVGMLLHAVQLKQQVQQNASRLPIAAAEVDLQNWELRLSRLRNVQLLRWLRAKPSVTALNLSKCSMPDKMGTALAPALVAHGSLVHVDLSFNMLTDLTGEALLAAAEKIPTLCRLDVRGNPIRQELQAKLEGLLRAREGAAEAVPLFEQVPFKPRFPAHQSSRLEKHKDYVGKRMHVSDDKVPWEVHWPEYDPPDCTADLILENERGKATGDGWADPADPAAMRTDLEKRVTWASQAMPSITAEIEPGVYTRISSDLTRKAPLLETVGMCSKSGAPLNPHGRTGLQSRGLLGLWGGNHATDPILTRLSPQTRKLQVLVIERRDTGEIAIPGEMVQPGELMSAKIRTILVDLLGKEAAENLEKRATVVTAGYADDPRNTDNAWMETVAAHFHCTAEESLLLDALPYWSCKADTDVGSAAAWIDVDEELFKTSFNANHLRMVNLAVAGFC